MKMSSARVRCKSVPSRELSTLILHRDTGITDPERPVNLPDLTVGASVPFAEMIASGMAT